MAQLINFGLYREKRIKLIDELKLRKELDLKVLDAILNLPREIFISPIHINRAYDDNALPIGCNQTISQPYTVAFMTSLLKIKSGDKILEIGTGSGYQAALLSLLGAKVFSIERHRTLYDNARKIFKSLELNIQTMCGDGTLGWKDFAPFQGIIITAAAPKVPEILQNQLAIGGRLVVPIGDAEVQTMYLIEKRSEKSFHVTKHSEFKFVPLIGAEGWNE